MAGCGQIPARQLVFALRTRFDTRQAQLNGGLDGLIVAQLEMQAAVIFDTAPVAAEKRLLAYKVERPGDGCAVTLGQYQDHVVAQGLLSDIEKFAGQVGRAPFATACILIELPEGVPMFGFDLIACEATDGSAKVLRLGALAADVLALACGQGCEEV